MFDTNPITKMMFIMIAIVYSVSVFYVKDVEYLEITAYVFIVTFISLVLRAETLGSIGKTIAEAFKSKWSK